MPSARALLVASLLTEPPYGCLGPSGNDRYRKRSLRSQTVRLRKSTAKSRRLFRNESATSRRVRAGAIGGSTAMTRTAFCRKSPRVPRVCWLGSWALGTSNRGGQDKARKVRAVGCDGKQQQTPTTWPTLLNIRRNFHVSATRHCCSAFHTL
jgi:hypothetical protein